MDVAGGFFNKLRTLAVTLEKQTEEFNKISHNRGTEEFEEDSPMRHLYELYSEVRTLKGDADNMLSKSSSERDATYDFIKAAKVLMKRNASDVKEIEDLFQKYGYKPAVVKDTAAQSEAEVKPESNQVEPEDLSGPEKSSWSHSPLQVPQLSDFGLSRYAVPNSSSIIQKTQKEEARAGYPDHLSPKAEHFHIHGHNLHINDETTSLTEDQTIFLLHNAKNARQANKPEQSVEPVSSTIATPKQKKTLSDYDYTASPAVPSFCTPGLKVPCREAAALPKSPEHKQSGGSKDLAEIPLSEAQSRKTESEVYNKITSGRDLMESTVERTVHQDCFEEPSPPPVLSDYNNLLKTPPPPSPITVIPEQIFQILSRNIPKPETSRLADKESILQIHDKENRNYSG